MLHPFNFASLFVEARIGSKPLATATAFVTIVDKAWLLVTNRHVVAGKDTPPDRLAIRYPTRSGSIVLEESLVDANWAPKWVEHPRLRDEADIAVLRLVNLDASIACKGFDLRDVKDPLIVGPAEPVSVIGYPFGKSASTLPIWATGFVASEPGVDYENKPVFLIDCRTRMGQSGSPVVAVRTATMVAAYEDGSTELGAMRHRFMGLYSGRINDQSDLGMVWKVAAVRETVLSA